MAWDWVLMGRYFVPVYSDVFTKKDSTGELYPSPLEKLSNTAYIYRPNGRKVFKEGISILLQLGGALFGVGPKKGEFVIPYP